MIYYTIDIIQHIWLIKNIFRPLFPQNTKMEIK